MDTVADHRRNRNPHRRCGGWQTPGKCTLLYACWTNWRTSLLEHNCNQTVYEKLKATDSSNVEYALLEHPHDKNMSGGTPSNSSPEPCMKRGSITKLSTNINLVKEHLGNQNKFHFHLGKNHIWWSYRTTRIRMNLRRCFARGLIMYECLSVLSQTPYWLLQVY